ncbi:MAG: transcription elongation factor GreA [Anaerolineae bacterium]|jgi:transcription elongation factor GreA|nr:transcription elongation factor GreA [Anaerolineae bacterium]
MDHDAVYLTPEGKAQAEQELSDLVNVKRPALAERLHFAIKQGDLSENADYQAAKEEQAFLEGRILHLQHVLRVGQLINTGEASSDGRVKLGSVITVIEEGYDDTETYYLVGRTEADPSKGRISHASPLGKALLGHVAGDTVSIAAPAGRMSFKILEVA